MGWGPGVCVPRKLLENEVIAGLQGLLGACIDKSRQLRKVNRELKEKWRKSAGICPEVPKKIKAADEKIVNIRNSIENGLTDTGWANVRMEELMADRRWLQSSPSPPDGPPQINADTLSRYTKDLGRVLSQGKPAERKRFVGMCVEKK